MNLIKVEPNQKEQAEKNLVKIKKNTAENSYSKEEEEESHKPQIDTHGSQESKEVGKSEF